MTFEDEICLRALRLVNLGPGRQPSENDMEYARDILRSLPIAEMLARRLRECSRGPQ